MKDHKTFDLGENSQKPAALLKISFICTILEKKEPMSYMAS